jgi:hypothetical protein
VTVAGLEMQEPAVVAGVRSLDVKISPRGIFVVADLNPDRWRVRHDHHHGTVAGRQVLRRAFSAGEQSVTCAFVAAGASLMARRRSEPVAPGSAPPAVANGADVAERAARTTSAATP